MTAVAFAQACSALLPRDPGAACMVGRLARKAGLLPSAGEWLAWAREVATLQDDPNALARAALLLGCLCYERRDLEEAGDLFFEAATESSEVCDHATEGDAHACLAVLCYEQGRTAAGATHVVSAALAFGPNIPRQVELAAETAWIWTNLGFYTMAATLCQALAPRVADPVRRALVHALQCRALSAAQDDPGHERAWNLAWAALGSAPGAGGPRAFVLLQLARAADTRGHFTRAATAAHMACQAAHTAGQPRWAREAADMISVLDGSETSTGAMAAAFPERRYAGFDPVRDGAEEEQERALSALLTFLAPEPSLDLPSSLSRALAPEHG